MCRLSNITVRQVYCTSWTMMMVKSCQAIRRCWWWLVEVKVGVIYVHIQEQLYSRMIRKRVYIPTIRATQCKASANTRSSVRALLLDSSDRHTMLSSIKLSVLQRMRHMLECVCLSVGSRIGWWVLHFVFVCLPKNIILYWISRIVVVGWFCSGPIFSRFV